MADVFCGKCYNAAGKLEARIAELEGALRLVDADVRHHLRSGYEGSGTIPASIIRPCAIKAVRDALGLSKPST